MKNSWIDRPGAPAFGLTLAPQNMEAPMKMLTKSVSCVVALAMAVATQAAVVTTTPMNDLINDGVVGDGSVSTIVRDANGVTVTVHTRLEAGLYTLWLLIWNDPESCVGAPGSRVRCIPRQDPPNSVIYATGIGVAQTGMAHFGMRLNVGDDSNVTGGAVRDGLTNAMGAEIHAVVRAKRDPIDGRALEQLSNFEGGCDVNDCANVQGGVHDAEVEDETAMMFEEVKDLLRRMARRMGLNP